MWYFTSLLAIPEESHIGFWKPILRKVMVLSDSVKGQESCKVTSTFDSTISLNFPLCQYVKVYAYFSKIHDSDVVQLK